MNKFLKCLLGITAGAVLLSGCNSNKPASVLKDGESDLEYVGNKGTFVIGITDFAPMDFPENGSWEGFDASLAKKFAEQLGVTPEFKEIDWDKKADLLADGTIDCVWNGMTYTEELAQEITCSDAYISNAQVIVMNKDEISKYSSADECQHLLFAAETGSTGEALLQEKKFRYAVFDTQKDALQSVLDGKTDAAVIDIIMAGYYTAKESGFESLAFDFPLNDEKICAGLRKGSDIAPKLNEFLKNAGSDGTLKELADAYGITEAILE